MAIVKCPNCGRETEFTGNEFRPFCSERCKLLDLGAWADGEYSLPAELTELSESDLETVLNAAEENDK